MVSGLFASIVCIGLIAGLYPAFFLAKFNPVDTLGGHTQGRATAGFLRKTLVIFQFVLSIVLLYHHACIAQSTGLYEKPGRGVLIGNRWS